MKPKKCSVVLFLMLSWLFLVSDSPAATRGDANGIKIISCYDRQEELIPLYEGIPLEDIPTPIDVAGDFVSYLEKNPSHPLRENFYHGIVKTGRCAVIPLADALKRPNSETFQIMAIEILGDIGKDAAGAVGILREKLGSNSSTVRIRAARTLAKIGPDAGPAVGNLIKALDDNDPDVRLWSAIALGRIGPESAPAVSKLLILALGDGSLIVRKAAISAIGNIGPLAKIAAAPQLNAIMTRSDANGSRDELRLQLYAAKSLLQIDPENRAPAEKIISSIDVNKKKDFASYLLFKLGNMVKPDIEKALSLEARDSPKAMRLSEILWEIKKGRYD